VAGACLRFDPAPAAAVFDRWTRRYPAFAEPGRERVGAHVARCVGQLEALDRNRAADLQQRTVALFGPLPGVVSLRDDPCAAEYLVDNGVRVAAPAPARTASARRPGTAARGGERSRARREVRDHPPGDQLGRSGRLLREWRRVPVAGSARHAGRRRADRPRPGYARWLSEQTGFPLPLPSYAQWRRAAQGADDPNRNCQVRLGSVRRGLAPVAVGVGAPNPQGLLNVLGNVQEWVIDDGAVKAAGGAFTDPIAVCTVDALRGTTAARTVPPGSVWFGRYRELHEAVARIGALRRLAKAHAAGELSTAEYRASRREVIDNFAAGGFVEPGRRRRHPATLAGRHHPAGRSRGRRDGGREGTRPMPAAPAGACCGW
jgi:hypothetical protein